MIVLFYECFHLASLYIYTFKKCLSTTVPCAIGTYLDTRVNYCVFCKKGTYQNAEAQITCVDCPRGYTTENDGNYDVDQCSGRFTVRVSHRKHSNRRRRNCSSTFVFKVR